MLLYFLVIVNRLLCIPSFHYCLKKASTITPAPNENNKAELDYLKKKHVLKHININRKLMGEVNDKKTAQR